MVMRQAGNTDLPVLALKANGLHRFWYPERLPFGVLDLRQA